MGPPMDVGVLELCILDDLVNPFCWLLLVKFYVNLLMKFLCILSLVEATIVVQGSSTGCGTVGAAYLL